MNHGLMLRHRAFQGYFFLIEHRKSIFDLP